MNATCLSVCRYVRSLDSDQLGGNYVDASGLGSCAPQQYADSSEYLDFNGAAVPPNTAINPCGLMAYSYFNDSFSLRQGSDNINLDVSSHALHSL